MPKARGKQPARPCQNCEQPVTKLGRLVTTFPSGEQRTLFVCAFCYLQLAPHARPAASTLRAQRGSRWSHEWIHSHS